MTTELVLLLAIFAFVTAGAFFGDKGPIRVFERSGPRLGARLEQQISVGHDFRVKDGAPLQWEPPQAPPPTGQL